jgi:hypothetical protein
MIRTIAILWFVLGALGALPAMFSVMMVDAPGATDRPATMALMAATMGFPIACFASGIAALDMRRQDNRTKAYVALCIPLVVAIVGIAAAAWIEIMQGGKFNG